MPLWFPPTPPAVRADPRRIPGVLAGTLLYDQPRHRDRRDVLLEFVEGPVAVEVGFDHGMVLLDAARLFPEVRWLGLELRERQVDAVRPHAPPNCLVFRGDARAVFAALLPPASVSAIYVLFPDPVWVEARRARHLLFSAGFVEAVARVLRPDGVLHVATDIGPYFEYIRALLGGWEAAEAPPRPATLSRRERVCQRDGLPVYRGSWTPTSSPTR